MPARVARLSLWVLGAAIILQFVMPFVYPIVGYDAWIHLNWLEQFPKLFRDGNLYPRWMPDSFWGFGSPAFYFYPPLAYWCASLISFIFPNSPVAIYQTLGLLATIASVATCYWYLRSLVDSKRSAFIGSLVYGVFPYRFIDLYLRNAIGEHIAFVFLPLILLSIEMSLRTEEKKILFRSILISAIGWVGLFLTNIPTAVISIYAATIYSWIRSGENKQYEKFFFPLIGASVGAMIAAVYLLPISEYSSAVKLSHLWDLKEIAENTGYVILDIVHGNHRYFDVGLILVFAIGLWLLYRFFREGGSKVSTNLPLLFGILMLIAIVLQIPIIQPLWNFLPLFNLIQFSYRWDIIIVTASAVFVALYYDSVREKSIACFICVISLVTIVLALGYFFAVDGMHWQYKTTTGHIDPPEYITASANNNIQIAINDLKAHAMDPPILMLNDSFKVHLYSVTPESMRFVVDGPKEDIQVAFHRMCFPAWKLRMNAGNEIYLTSDSLGRINAVLPGIQAEYVLSLEKSQTEKTGKIISISGLFLFVICLAITISWQNPKAS